MELLAILLALTWRRGPNQYIICSDSMASLISIANCKSVCRPDLIYEIFHSLYRLQNLNITVCLMWVPSHVEIEGNEVVDRMAKKTLKSDLQWTVPE